MADISKINPDGGLTVYDLKDAYVRSLVPSNADPSTNKLATMADVSGGGGGGITPIYNEFFEVNTASDYLDYPAELEANKMYLIVSYSGTFTNPPLQTAVPTIIKGGFTTEIRGGQPNGLSEMRYYCKQVYNNTTEKYTLQFKRSGNTNSVLMVFSI